MKKFILTLTLIFFLLSACNRQPYYESKRETKEVVEVISNGKEAPSERVALSKGRVVENVNLRSEPSTESSILLNVAPNTEVEWISEQNEEDVLWSRIIVDNSVGYIQSQYLEINE